MRIEKTIESTSLDIMINWSNQWVIRLPEVVDIVPDLANNGTPPLLPLSLDVDVEVYRNLRILKVL